MEKNLHHLKHSNKCKYIKAHAGVGGGEARKITEAIIRSN